MDHHTVAAVSITGKLDVLGSLYLAYDLLGGQHGPLRLLTRAVTYSIVFGIGYGIGLGLFLASPRVSRQASPCPQSGSPWPRPLSFALGSTVQRHPRGCFWRRTGRMLGLRFAIAFGILITIGQVFAYSRGMRPATDYIASRRSRITRRQFWGTVVRTVGYIGTALLCSALVNHVDHAWYFAIRVGLVAGLVTGIGVTVNPYIESTLITSRSDGSESSAALPCNPSSIGWRYLMSGSRRHRDMRVVRLRIVLTPGGWPVQAQLRRGFSVGLSHVSL